MPKIFDAFLCYKKEVKVCTYSFTFFYSKIAERSEKYTLIEAGDCKLMSKQQHPSIEIFQLSSQLWGTEEAEKINYDFIGTNCETTENYFLEVGEGGIYKGKIMTEWIKDIEPTEDFHSESNLGIITWDIPDETYFFTHKAKRVKA